MEVTMDILLVGGAGGLGCAISAYLAERGYRVFSCDIGDKHCTHENVVALRTDITDKASIQETDGCQVRVVHMNRVSKAWKDSISDKELNRLTRTYKILGDQTRLRIVMALAGGEMCVCDIAAFLGISESAVSHQLRRLRDMSIAKNRRDGQILYYSLDDEHVVNLLNLGLEHIRE
jgi:DNA-binding transcriptional ArsR family regulator